MAYSVQTRDTKAKALLAVGLSMDEETLLCEEVSSLFSGQINVTASNLPESVIFSGDLEAILLAEQQLKDRGVFCRLLRVSTASNNGSILVLTTKDGLDKMSKITFEQWKKELK